jgi:hypothetical protein
MTAERERITAPKGRARSACAALFLFAALLSPAAAQNASQHSADDAAYRASVEKWRADFEADLRSDHGWLVVAGLFWLHEGDNKFGSDPLNDIVLPASAPENAGSFDLNGQKVRSDLNSAFSGPRIWIVLAGIMASLSRPPNSSPTPRPIASRSAISLFTSTPAARAASFACSTKIALFAAISRACLPARRRWTVPARAANALHRLPAYRSRSKTCSTSPACQHSPAPKSIVTRRPRSATRR